MSFSLNSTLEKMSSRDKDFRYMATSDLVKELTKENFKLDAASQTRLVEMLLKLLDDTSNDVQEIAATCLGPLVSKVGDAQVQQIGQQLVDHLLNQDKAKDELRDISSIGLRTVINQIPLEPAASATLLARRATPRLLDALVESDQCKPQAQLHLLDALNELLAKFGKLMAGDHEKIQKTLLPLLASSRAAARKRAISCLAHLAMCSTDALFQQLVVHIVERVEKDAKKADLVCTLIQAIAAITRIAGHRLGHHLDRLAPLVIKYADSTQIKDEKGSELRENCFQCFESLVLRCPKQVTPHLRDIIDKAITQLHYDPNYADDEDVDKMETDDEDKEDDDDEELSGDDDMSWKVRRSAAKCLQAVIRTRPEQLEALYTQATPKSKDKRGELPVAVDLVLRFAEREENVRLDIFATVVALIRATVAAARRATASASASAAAAAVDSTAAAAAATGKPNHPIELLSKLVPALVTALARSLKDKSVKTRIGALSVLKELVQVRVGMLGEHVGALMPGLVQSLSDAKNRDSNLKIETLLFARLLLASHSPAVFFPHIPTLVTPVLRAVEESYYRVSAEALRLLSQLVQTMRAEPVRGQAGDFDFKPHVAPMFATTLSKLEATDVDQEVKECTISAAALIVSHFGDELALDKVLQLFLERLRNEITRLTAVKALAEIAGSPLALDISPILPEALADLASFLRQSNRQLRQSALSTLFVIVEHYGTAETAQKLFASVLAETCSLVSDSDLHNSHLALQLCSSVLRAQPKQADVVRERIVPPVLVLLRSSLLQGHALESLCALLAQLVIAAPRVYDELLSSLLALVATKKDSKEMVLGKQCYTSIAQAVAAVVVAGDAAKRDASVQQFVANVQKDHTDSTAKLLLLLALGEIGRRVDLAGHATLPNVLLVAFSGSEEIKQASSFALGNVAVGSLAKMMPFIMSQITSGGDAARAKPLYLLLHSLREAIVRQSAIAPLGLQPYLSQLLPLLFVHAESDEEGSRNVVAECLGKLAVVEPELLMPQLREGTKGSALARATVVTAVKFTISDKPLAVDALLHKHIAEFLALITDPDINVRKATLLLLNYAAHNKPALISELLPATLPSLYAETKVKPALIRQVDLGPFKHKVDDGLEVRKAAFECMYTLLGTSSDRLDISVFIQNVVDALSDHYDIKLLAHLMLIRLALHGPTLLDELEKLLPPLKATVVLKLAENAVKQEVERNEELVRSALRAIAAISRIPNVYACKAFEDFVTSVVTKGDLAEKFAAVRSEGDDLRDVSVDAMDTA